MVLYMFLHLTFKLNYVFSFLYLVYYLFIYLLIKRAIQQLKNLNSLKFRLLLVFYEKNMFLKF